MHHTRLALASPRVDLIAHVFTNCQNRRVFLLPIGRSGGRSSTIEFYTPHETLGLAQTRPNCTHFRQDKECRDAINVFDITVGAHCVGYVCIQTYGKIKEMEDISPLATYLHEIL